ncbi:hypothetical protein [Pleomorphomonas carboxyditropha]|uniref:hypothetical protein n=1 Tax=Pleomorphomonas carboxyditropha TaxID=2023338 RepID=UPI0010555147|nr:hypothetical protein [Pleomorphomonas carboxyditropha]
MAFGKTARLVIVGLYVLAMLVVAVMPASAMAPMPASPTVTSAADCGPEMNGMQHASHGAKAAGGACSLSDHQGGGSAPCMLGSICADLPSGVFVSLLPAPVATESEQPVIVPAAPLPGLDPDPGLRPPSLSA